MLIIAHRGNLTSGPNRNRENHPDYIKEALRAGFQVEVDLWVEGQQAWLGHDRAQYGVDNWFLETEGLVVHCKNVAALVLCEAMQVDHYFAHDKDDVVLTSCGDLWTYPRSGIPLTNHSIPVILSRNDMIWDFEKVSQCYGICTDDALYYDALFNHTAT